MIIIHVTLVQESPGHAARVVVNQGDIHLANVSHHENAPRVEGLKQLERGSQN